MIRNFIQIASKSMQTEGFCPHRASTAGVTTPEWSIKRQGSKIKRGPWFPRPETAEIAPRPSTGLSERFCTGNNRTDADRHWREIGA